MLRKQAAGLETKLKRADHLVTGLAGEKSRLVPIICASSLIICNDYVLESETQSMINDSTKYFWPHGYFIN